MQTRNMFLIVSFVAIFAVAVGALVISSVSDVQDVPLAASQETPPQDGVSLMNSHCARCHSAELLKQIDQTRAEWETSLAKMEKMGVILSDDEKIILIDYLTRVDKP